MKTSENDVKYSSFNIGEVDKSRELYSKEGDNSSRFEGKTMPWEHTIPVIANKQSQSYYEKEPLRPKQNMSVSGNVLKKN